MINGNHKNTYMPKRIDIDPCCPNCNAVWTLEEIETDSCDSCGYPYNDDNDDYDYDDDDLY